MKMIVRPALFGQALVELEGRDQRTNAAPGFINIHGLDENAELNQLGVYQMGEVQARSRISFAIAGSLHAGGRSATGRARQCHPVQRQLGRSSTLE